MPPQVWGKSFVIPEKSFFTQVHDIIQIVLKNCPKTLTQFWTFHKNHSILEWKSIHMEFFT